jgi:hypothetical protein
MITTFGEKRRSRLPTAFQKIQNKIKGNIHKKILSAALLFIVVPKIIERLPPLCHAAFIAASMDAGT